MGRSYLIFYILILFISCKSDNNPRTYRLSKDPVENTIIDKQPIKQKNDFTWDVPNNWIVKENDSFSLASYQIPFKSYLADLSITKFTGDAGGPVANVNRWRRQLGLEPHSMQQINKSSMIGSSSLGNFSSYKLINEETDQAFLCSILPYEGSTIFIKLKSNIATTILLEKIFLDFCSSFRGEN
tara:strand:- start:1125 stop:1676 length:552 start_codon:yes stop_codon:yes gene_type:complete